MALAGAGNPVGGSNPSGTGTGLNHVGNHAYAYSGLISFDNNETTMLDFSLGYNQYLVGKIQFFYFGDTSQDVEYSVKVNGELLQRYETNAPQEYTEPDGIIPIIFVGGDRVQLIIKNLTDSATLTGTVTLTGRIYA
jgi:hypothetical protein